MRRGIFIFFGIIFVIIGLIQLLPLVGISVVIGGFDLDKWFPVVFLMVGFLELISVDNSGWFWGIVMLVYGGLKLSQHMGWAIPLLDILNVEALLIPIFLFIYGLKSLAVSC